jgi:hypothetical protein
MKKTITYLSSLMLVLVLIGSSLAYRWPHGDPDKALIACYQDIINALTIK